MSQDQKKTPVETLRESNLSANIWENQSDRGAYYKTTFSRSFQDQQGQWQQTASFGERDLLPLSNLAGRTHDAVRQLKEQQREATRETERQTNRSRARDPDRGRER